MKSSLSLTSSSGWRVNLIFFTDVGTGLSPRLISLCLAMLREYVAYVRRHLSASWSRKERKPKWSVVMCRALTDNAAARGAGGSLLLSRIPGPAEESMGS